MNKDKFKQESLKWGKRAVIFGVLGFTGLAVVGAVNIYRTVRGLERIDLDDLKL